jgi:hypothetical protein
VTQIPLPLRKVRSSAVFHRRSWLSPSSSNAIDDNNRLITSSRLGRGVREGMLMLYLSSLVVATLMVAADK